MDAIALIPTPEAIPAPWPLFEILGVLLFIVHILFINVVVGGTLLALFSKAPERNSVTTVLVKKIPSTLALGVTFGIAPLLFLQVLYGHLIYSSSVLMAFYWLLVIPLLIIAYYSTYVHTHTTARWLGRAAIAVAAAIFLYIGFIYTNNMTLMLQPEKWSAYFTRRGGTILNLDDAAMWPRYLHFVVASVAVAGLFSSLVWQIRAKRGNRDHREEINRGLKIFAWATSLQFLVGIWFLIALPREVMLAFMGRNLFYTLQLLLAILLTLGAVVMAFRGKFRPAFYHLLATMLVMAFNRLAVRDLYVSRFFDVATLETRPQFDVLILFTLILAAGLAVIWYMVRAMLSAAAGREES